MTNKDILKIAMEQSAVDSNCSPDDFVSCQNKVVISAPNNNARNYLQLPFICDFTSYGNNIVASASQELQGIASEYISSLAIEHCFETPGLHLLMKKLEPYNANVCFMAEYFLPNADALVPLKCAYETKVLSEGDFSDLYLPQWGNALCADRKHLDRLGVGAYHQGRLIGLAACSADCETMWQIGVDVLPEYRKQGVASALTSMLAREILQRGIVPFYCCAWSNLKSVRNAIKSGFSPAWVQLTVKSNEFINSLGK